MFAVLPGSRFRDGEKDCSAAAGQEPIGANAGWPQLRLAHVRQKRLKPEKGKRCSRCGKLDHRQDGDCTLKPLEVNLGSGKYMWILRDMYASLGIHMHPRGPWEFYLDPDRCTQALGAWCTFLLVHTGFS